MTYIHLPNKEELLRMDQVEYKSTELKYCDKCRHKTVHTITRNAEGTVIKTDCHKCWE